MEVSEMVSFYKCLRSWQGISAPPPQKKPGGIGGTQDKLSNNPFVWLANWQPTCACGFELVFWSTKTTMAIAL